MKHHNFEFGLPLYPHQAIGEAQSPDLKLEMDGKELQGVTSLTARAWANGFTNVAIEFDCSAAIKMALHSYPASKRMKSRLNASGLSTMKLWLKLKISLTMGKLWMIITWPASLSTRS